MNVSEIIKQAEQDLLKRTGNIFRISVEFCLPAYAQEGVRSICQAWGITEAALHEKTRREPIMTMRTIVGLYLRQECRLPYQQIGRYFDKDHTTILHAVKNSYRFLQTNDEQFMTYYTPVHHLFDNNNEKI